jgi:hypothetical protein
MTPRPNELFSLLLPARLYFHQASHGLQPQLQADIPEKMPYPYLIAQITEAASNTLTTLAGSGV